MEGAGIEKNPPKEKKIVASKLENSPKSGNVKF